VRSVRKTAVALGVLATCLIAASPAAAHQGQTRLAPASARLGGLTGGELLGEEFQQLFELPADVNPSNPAATNPTVCLSAGRHDQVLIVWTQPVGAANPTICTVKPGTPVFFYALGGDCSSVEAPPFFGATADEQRACILGVIRTCGCVGVRPVSVDGAAPVNIGTDRYLAVSPPESAQLPADNIFGVPPQQATFVAAGYVGMVRPLPPGRHTITTEVPGSPPVTQVAIVDVVPGLH